VAAIVRAVEGVIPMKHVRVHVVEFVAMIGLVCGVVGCGPSFDRDKLRATNDRGAEVLEALAANCGKMHDIARVYVEDDYDRILGQARNQLDMRFNAVQSILLEDRTRRRDDLKQEIDGLNAAILQAETIINKPEANTTTRATNPSEDLNAQEQRKNAQEALDKARARLPDAQAELNALAAVGPGQRWAPKTSTDLAKSDPKVRDLGSLSPDQNISKIQLDLARYFNLLDELVISFSTQMEVSQTISVDKYWKAQIGGSLDKLEIPPRLKMQAESEYGRANREIESILANFSPYKELRQHRGEVLGQGKRI